MNNKTNTPCIPTSLNLSSIKRKVHELSFDALFNHLPVSFFWLDRAGVLLGCNERVLQDLHIDDMENFVGKHVTEIASYEAWENSQWVMDNDKDLTAEEIHTHETGDKIYYLSIKSPLHDQNANVIGLLGIAINVTEYKTIEELKRQKELALAQATASEAKARAEAETRQAVMVLAGSIAHDLRTPLLSLRTMASAIKRIVPSLISEYQGTELDAQYLAKFSRLLDLFEPIVDDMNGSINHSLQALSRVLTNELSDEDLLACDSDKCLHNALDRYPFAEGERELLEWNRDYVFTFRGNPILFTRIISNLVKNSLEQIKQQDKGKIFIRAHDDGDTNLLCIRDTAGGAPPEVVAKLFEGYQTTKQTGTGVGLAFCKLTMQSFGGDISCESVYGDYIEFRLRFPKIHGE